MQFGPRCKHSARQSSSYLGRYPPTFLGWQSAADAVRTGSRTRDHDGRAAREVEADLARGVPPSGRARESRTRSTHQTQAGRIRANHGEKESPKSSRLASVPVPEDGTPTAGPPSGRGRWVRPDAVAGGICLGWPAGGLPFVRVASGSPNPDCVRGSQRAHRHPRIPSSLDGSCSVRIESG